MKSNNLNIGESVYNYKYKYVRLYIGPSLTEWLKKFKNESELHKLLIAHSSLYKFGIKLVLDASSEAEAPYQSLKEENQIYRLEWILNWKRGNFIKDDMFEIWTSDFNCKTNNDKYSFLFRTVNQYKNNVARAMDIDFLENRNFDRKFLCPMSRNTRERKKLFEMFESNNDLKNNSYYSFNFRENGIYPNGEEDEKLPHLSLERYINLNEYNRTEFAGFQFQIKTPINILCETMFYKNNLQGEPSIERFFTEKTFRPIAICQPFIYIGINGMLKKLKSYGFKTFDKWWDESYDDIDNDDLRIEKIIEIIKNLNNKSLDELKNIYIEMIPILKHNFYNLFSIQEKYYEFHTDYNYNCIGSNEFYYFDYETQFKNL